MIQQQLTHMIHYAEQKWGGKMKSSTQVIGLPVISIQNGSSTRTSEVTCLKPRKRNSRFLIVDQEIGKLV